MKKDNVVDVEQAEKDVLEQPLVVVKFNPIDITNKIVKFCQAISGIPFYPYQEEYAYGIVFSLVTNDGEEVTALFSRQSGKTETNACVIAGCMVILPKLAELFPDYEPLQAYKDGLWVGIFAPSGDQAETTFSRTKSRIRSHDAKLILRDDDLKLDLKVIGSIIWLTNGSFCTSMSASKNAHIESKTYHLIIIEEAQDADNRVVRKCLPGDTRVLTSGGYRLLEEVVKGEVEDVAYMKGMEKLDFAKPLEYFDNGVQSVFKVRVVGGREIEATENHQFYVRERNGNRKPRWATVAEIKEGKFQICVPDELPVFGEEGSYEDGLLAGYMLGDGNMSGDKPLFIGTRRTVERLSIIVESGTKVYKEHENGMQEVAFTTPGNKVGGNPTTNRLKDLGIWGTKGSGKKLPDRLFSREFYRGLVEGLIETDGCIESYEKKPVISFANISKDLVNQLRDVLLKFGVHCSVFYDKDNGEVNGYKSKPISILNIKGSKDIVRFGDTFSLYEKQEKLEKAYSVAVRKTDRRSGKGKRGYSENLRFYGVDSVSYVGEKQTYCLSMPDRNFIANNLVSSNSIHPMGASCVVGSTLIAMPDGKFVPIKEVVEKREYKGVISVNQETLKREVSRITDYVDSGEQETLIVRTDSGKVIQGTLDHPLLIKERSYPRIPQWKEMQDIEVGMQIAVPRVVDFFGSKNEKYARLIGMLIGDGSYRSRGMVRYCSEDEELWEYVLGFEFEVNYCGEHITKLGRRYREGTLKGAVPILREMGIYGQVGKEKTLPKNIWDWDKESLCELLGGLFDTDGDVLVSEDRRVTITCTQSSKYVVEQMQIGLMKLGVQSKIVERTQVEGAKGEGNIFYRLWIRDKESIENFHQNIRFLVKRKQRTLEKGIDVLKGQKYKIQKNLLDSDIRFEKIVSVEYGGREQVYDLTVEGAHNFIANGVYAHNTNATIIKVGTANEKKSDFLEAIKRNRRKNLNGKRKFHFEYNYKIVQKFNPRYKKFIEKEKERLGADSDEFRMAYGCEFILERGMFCTEERFDAMCQLVPGLELCHGLKIGTQVAGIDIGKASDPTVVTVADVDWANPVFIDEESHTYYYRKRVLDWLELLGDDHESQFYQIIDFLDKYNIRAIAIDSTGKGDPVADRFKAYYEGRCDVIAVTFSMSSKSRMYKLLNAEIIANRWEIPNGSRVERSRKWRKFKNEMLDLEKSWRGTYMVVHHPNEKDAHDDYPDSLALCNIAAMVEAMGEVEVSDNELFNRTPRGVSHTSGRKRGRRTV